MRRLFMHIAESILLYGVELQMEESRKRIAGMQRRAK